MEVAPITAGRILWIDNDPAYIQPFVIALQGEGFDVKVIKSAARAEAEIGVQLFDLVILDVMIPTINESEEDTYKPSETDDGHKTGLLLFKRVKARLEGNRIPVLVMTVRIDKGITKEFLDAGLPSSCFVTKMDLKETPDFLDRVRSLVMAKNNLAKEV